MSNQIEETRERARFWLERLDDGIDATEDINRDEVLGDLYQEAGDALVHFYLAVEDHAEELSATGNPDDAFYDAAKDIMGRHLADELGLSADYSGTEVYDALLEESSIEGETA